MYHPRTTIVKIGFGPRTKLGLPPPLRTQNCHQLLTHSSPKPRTHQFLTPRSQKIARGSAPEPLDYALQSADPEVTACGSPFEKKPSKKVLKRNLRAWNPTFGYPQQSYHDRTTIVPRSYHDCTTIAKIGFSPTSKTENCHQLLAPRSPKPKTVTNF